MTTATRYPTRPGEPPTPRQLEVYRLVLKYFAEHGHAPTAVEVARADGKALPSAVSSQLRALAGKGWVELPTDGRGRGIVVPELRDETRAQAAAMERAARGDGLKTLPRRGGEPIRRGDPPTPLQARVYRLVLKFFARHGYPPTLRELTELAGATSTSVVVAHLRGLHKRGLVVVKKPAAKAPRQARNLEVPRLRDAAMALAARLLAETK